MAWVTKDSTETYNQTPEPPREYTKKEKAANWWHYHWMAVVVAVLVVVFGVWIIKDTVFQTRPDVQVAYVGTSDLPTDTVTALQDALTPFCSDLNGDGKVVVQVDSYTVDFDAANENTDAYYQMAGVTRLSAELSSGGKTYIFLLEDPEGFETQTGALQYLDGTVPDDPETTDADWREMVRQLVVGNEAVCKTARKVLKTADGAGDDPTVDLMTQRLNIHEKNAWMLRSLLQ